MYEIVNALRNNSGWSWDDEKGADISPEKKGVWDDYVLAHPLASPFRNCGWIHLAIFDLFGSKITKGTHVFHASQGVTSEERALPPPSARESSPPWPENLRDSDDTQVGPEDGDEEEEEETQVCATAFVLAKNYSKSNRTFLYLLLYLLLIVSELPA